jgi:CHASE3 domain sensor protein
MPQTVLEQLEHASKRVESATSRRNAIQAKLEAARQLYAEALKEAQGLVDARREKKRHPDLLKPGVEVNLDLLRAVLTREEAENAKAVAEFVRAVDDFETFISRIEKALADPEAMNELLLTITPVAAAVASPAPAEVAAAASSQPAVQFNEDDI